jgi:TctA family transporter
MVLGPIVEQNFMVSMVKTDWDLTQFFSRPAAAVLGILTIIVWLMPLYPILLRKVHRR